MARTTKPKAPVVDPRDFFKTPAAPAPADLPPAPVAAPLPEVPPTSAFDEPEDADGPEQNAKTSRFVQLTPNFGVQLMRNPYGAMLFERYMAEEDVVWRRTMEVVTRKGEWTKWKRRGFYPNLVWLCSAVLREQLFFDVNNAAAATDRMNIQALMMLMINRDIELRDHIMDLMETVLSAVVEDGELMPIAGSRPPLYGAAELEMVKQQELLGRLKGMWARKLNVPEALGAEAVKE